MLGFSSIYGLEESKGPAGEPRTQKENWRSVVSWKSSGKTKKVQGKIIKKKLVSVKLAKVSKYHGKEEDMD